MMSGARTWRLIAFFGVLSAVLFAWMLSIGWRFARLLPRASLPDTDWNSTPGSIAALAGSLADHADAASLLRFLHLGPDMIFPAAATAFLLLLIRRFSRRAVLYGQVVTPNVRLALLAIPVAYLISDYVENVLCLLFFPPARPSSAIAEFAPVLIPWATRVKFMFLVVSAILAVWLAIGSSRRAIS